MALSQQLESTLSTYAVVERYEDTGRVLFLEGGAWRERRRFKTAFVRDEHLSLTVQLDELMNDGAEGGEVVIEVRGGAAAPATVLLFGKRKKPLDLSAALATYSGVTSAVSWLVPSLLLALVPGVRWFRDLFPEGASEVDAASGSVTVTARAHGPGTAPSCVAAVDHRSLLRSFELALPDRADPDFRQRFEWDEVRASI